MACATGDCALCPQHAAALVDDGAVDGRTVAFAIVLTPKDRKTPGNVHQARPQHVGAAQVDERARLRQVGRGGEKIRVREREHRRDGTRDECNADAGFAGKLNKLRVIGALYPSYIQVVATKASGIRSLAELKGKRRIILLAGVVPFE